jgi:hypothetical protein
VAEHLHYSEAFQNTGGTQLRQGFVGQAVRFLFSAHQLDKRTSPQVDPELWGLGSIPRRTAISEIAPFPLAKKKVNLQLKVVNLEFSWLAD